MCLYVYFLGKQIFFSVTRLKEDEDRIEAKGKQLMNTIANDVT